MPPASCGRRRTSSARPPEPTPEPGVGWPPVPIDAGAATVGRERELEQLDQALDGLASTAPNCLALAGEPGIGKTHLLSELRRRGEERHCVVLVGSATEFERDLPFSV